MTAVPAGYSLGVIKDGQVLDTIDLAGYDLSKTPARIVVLHDVEAAIAREERS